MTQWYQKSHNFYCEEWKKTLISIESNPFLHFSIPSKFTHLITTHEQRNIEVLKCFDSIWNFGRTFDCGNLIWNNSANIWGAFFMDWCLSPFVPPNPHNALVYDWQTCNRHLNKGKIEVKWNGFSLKSQVPLRRTKSIHISKRKKTEIKHGLNGIRFLHFVDRHQMKTSIVDSLQPIKLNGSPKLSPKMFRQFSILEMHQHW